MFGLPDAQLRWQIGPAALMRTGVEIVEMSRSQGQAGRPPMQDRSLTVIAFVRDIDATLARLKKLDATVVTPGGAPMTVPLGAQKARSAAVKGPGRPLRRNGTARSAARVAGAGDGERGQRTRARHGRDAEKSVRLYRECRLRELRAPVLPEKPEAWRPRSA